MKSPIFFWSHPMIECTNTVENKKIVRQTKHIIQKYKIYFGTLPREKKGNFPYSSFPKCTYLQMFEVSN